ncbi:hypothetical protein GCM10011511_48060 [Puia dinghuensis]|uniref:Uncharacterized protein n=2 Tax=Puia dinghuensis TaxID=1792502 RepID=A0A8J2XVT2_9BACT|nr:hypothetical protein GCM10011511_48060 [Puia dinghuensis]
MRADFADVAKYGTRQSGFEGLRSHSSGVKGSQFFYPTWSKGSLITNSNEKLGDKYMYLFDKVRQELFIQVPDSNAVYLVNKSQIHAFTLNTDKPHTFEIASDYIPGRTTDYFEILIKNDKYSLLKFTKTTLVKFDPHDMMRVKNGELYDEFVDEYTYYLTLKGGSLQAIPLRAGVIKKVLSAEKSKVNDYFDTNANEELDEKFLVGLIGFLNS